MACTITLPSVTSSLHGILGSVTWANVLDPDQRPGPTHGLRERGELALRHPSPTAHFVRAAPRTEANRSD
ncbi:unnamed protein product [Heligmosomoides polygyrus]|uniref:Uncharacterized protein n=1 Tax=Heligmosomoides polygyrus TaxID=6339 RepID=A0A183F896_HELPZ|nr:unnamed protein product [Heligmosomoides polygyrus]